MYNYYCKTNKKNGEDMTNLISGYNDSCQAVHKALNYAQNYTNNRLPNKCRTNKIIIDTSSYSGFIKTAPLSIAHFCSLKAARFVCSADHKIINLTWETFFHKGGLAAITRAVVLVITAAARALGFLIPVILVALCCLVGTLALGALPAYFYFTNHAKEKEDDEELVSSPKPYSIADENLPLTAPLTAEDLQGGSYD